MVIVGLGSGTTVPVLIGVVIRCVREGAVVISAQLTRVNKEPQPVTTPMKVGLPRDH
jgi:hypothetical protein